MCGDRILIGLSEHISIYYTVYNVNIEFSINPFKDNNQPTDLLNT